MSSLSKMTKQAKLIKAETQAKSCTYDEEKYHNHLDAQNVASIPSCVPLQAINKEIDEIVGFEEDETKIMEYLLGDQRQLDFISIVGMPGIGKTTLARKMYEDPSIVKYFDVRAWCTVSQSHQTTELLKTILGDLVTVADLAKIANDIKESKDENELENKLAERLYKTLKERRYLIVFDDIWDIKAWNKVQRYFPKDSSRSRILITTRHKEVASNIKEGSKVHTLREFTDVKSSELFWKMLKQPRRSFSKDFLEAGNLIVQSCKGLPLAIVVIARLLSKVEKSVHEWNKIARSLSSHILDNPQSPCMAILELSYNHLSDHLKSCFLYFGAFREDAVIPVQKLKRLWIAEGFVCNSVTRNLEDVAEEYFKDLISRSLVIATTERSLGGTKACRVHDLLYEFCLKKAKKESFLQWKKEGDHFGFSEVYDRQLITSDKAHPSTLSVRSLLHIFALDISGIYRDFSLLTVLDLRVSFMTFEDFCKIGLLIYLRYLAIEVNRVSTVCVPSSISSLSNLQYFFYRHSDIPPRWIEVPDSLWKMGKLRHVHFYPYAYFYLDDIKETSAIDNLEKLSTIRFCSREEVACLSRLPKLHKLSCIFEDEDCTWDESTNYLRFPELDFLNQLVSLKVIFIPYKYWGKSCDLKFPLRLQKLTLSRCRMLWEDISRMGTTLRKLKVLKIDDAPLSWPYGWQYKNHDATWNVNDEDFPRLKYLKLSNLTNITDWNASDNSFPKLEQLVLESCENLKEIPACFGERYTLQMITVKKCRKSVEESAERIQKEQEEMGNEQFKLYLS